MRRKCNGFNESLENQIRLLHVILKENKVLYNVLEQASHLELKNYYIGGGCICQTIWNYQNGNDLMYGISDFDIVYFDNSDLSYEAEDKVIKRTMNSLIQKINTSVIQKVNTLPMQKTDDLTIQNLHILPQSIQVHIDVKNQARVHLWYEERFDISITPYLSVEDAINTWPTTASAVGVRLENNNLNVYAPFGLNDMFGQIIRANKSLITQSTYDEKCKKWKSKWDTLEIIGW